MRVLIYSAKSYERPFFERYNQEHGFELEPLEARLTEKTAQLAHEGDVVCAFVNDRLDAQVLDILHQRGVRFLALRSAGFNHVDLKHAKNLGFRIARVPAYSPYAVAEHTVALMLGLNRRLHRASSRVREHNFSLEGLLGFDMHGRTAGIVGFGKIGQCVASILQGLGLNLLIHDPGIRETHQGELVDLETLWRASDIITLHCPLMPATYHLVDADAFKQMKTGVMLINTSRGGLVDAAAAVEALKSGKLGFLGLDVYEEEADLFFEDLSNHTIQDDIFARLLTFPNVMVTSHQGFFTEEALNGIVSTTLQNIAGFLSDSVAPANLV